MDTNEDNYNQGANLNAVVDTSATTEEVKTSVVSMSTTTSRLPFSFININTSGVQQELADYLSKPLKIDSFILDSSPFVKTYDLESYLHSGIWADKLKGFYGIRGTFCIKVQVSAQKFQQGLLLMTFQPMYNDMKYSGGQFSGWDRTTNLTTATQLPHMVMRINTDSSMEMKIPYRALCSHYNLLTRQGSWGRVTLREFVGLTTGSLAISSASVVVWLSLHDATFGAPCDPASIVTQMDISTQELKPGPVERTLGKVSRVLEVFSGIPDISFVVKPLTWATNIGSKVCSIFGWSKPINTMAIVRQNKHQNQYQNNCEGVDNAFNLGLTTTNSVAVEPGFGLDGLDEMSIAYIKTRSAFYSRIDWTENDLQGQELFLVKIDPSSFYSTSVKTGGVGTITHHTPISGLANCFNYWRGSFDFSLSVVKTNFHVGKLLISFSVGSTSSSFFGTNTQAYKTTIDGSQYLHREIIDIETDDKFNFSIPYVSMFPYSRVGQPIGVLQIFVMNQLRVPEIASNTVTLLLSVAGNKDFEFAFPRQPQTYPMAGRLGDPNAEPFIEVYDQQTPTIVSSWEVLPRNGVKVLRVNNLTGANILASGCGSNVRQYFDVTLSRSVFNDNGDAVFLDYPNGTILYVSWLGELNSVAQRTLDSDSSAIKYVVATQWEGTNENLIVVQINYDQSSYVNNSYLWLLTTEPIITTQMDLGMIGVSSEPNTMQTELASSCIGELILSTKQLMSRALPVTNTTFLSPLGGNYGRFPIIASRPHLVYPNQVGGLALGFADYYSYFGSCFAFSRGGIVLRIATSGNSSDFVLLSCIENSGRSIIIPSNPESRFRSMIFEKSSDGTQVSAYFPFYSTAYGRLNTRVCEGDVGCTYPFSTNVAAIVSYAVNGATRASIFPMRSAADDTQFGFFLGFPPMEEFTPSVN